MNGRHTGKCMNDGTCRLDSMYTITHLKSASVQKNRASCQVCSGISATEKNWFWFFQSWMWEPKPKVCECSFRCCVNNSIFSSTELLWFLWMCKIAQKTYTVNAHEESSHKIWDSRFLGVFGRLSRLRVNFSKVAYLHKPVGSRSAVVAKST